MASIDDLEAEASKEPEKVDKGLQQHKNAFMTRWGFQYNRKDMEKSLDELLDFVRLHR